jgi:hypothetical protein
LNFHGVTPFDNVVKKNGTLSARDKMPLVTGESNGQRPISPNAGLDATNVVRREKESGNQKQIRKPIRNWESEIRSATPVFRRGGRVGERVDSLYVYKYFYRSDMWITYSRVFKYWIED